MNVAADVQQRLAQHHVAGGAAARHYLLQYGDNQAVARDALNSMHAGSQGLRRMIFDRAMTERQIQRLLSSAHVYREFNTAADALANLDIARFIRLILREFPDAEFSRISVPDSVFLFRS
jgi:hypothetical protein